MSEWKEKYLTDFSILNYGDNLPSTSLKPYGYKVFGANGFIGFNDKYNLEKQTVLISCRGEYSGTINLVPEKTFVTNNSIPVCIKTNDVDTIFLFYKLQTLNKDQIVSGSAQPQVTINDLKKVKLTFPLISTQRNISRILSTVDAVIENTQAAIDKYKAIKQGMLHDLFTRGIDITTGKLRPKYEDAPSLYKESKLGMVPKEWEVEKLESLCSEKPTYGINAAAVDFTHQLPTYIRITDIDEEGNFSKKGRKCVDSPFASNYHLKKGDLVFARTGATVGKTYLYNETEGLLVYAGFLIKVSPNTKMLDSDFMKFLTETPYYLNWVGLMSQRSGQPGINGNEYGSFLVPKPGFTEQINIAAKLLTFQGKIHTEQSYLQKLQSIKQGLMLDLLSGRKLVTGKEGQMA
jgi:type I restriction enzyme S subunit